MGGLCAFGLRERLHLALALTVGVLLGVVCFDPLPKSCTLVLGGTLVLVATRLATA